MVKTHGTKATQETSDKCSSTQDRARIVQEYDRLIAQFGEDPFRPAAACQRSDGLALASGEVGTETPTQRHELLKEVTEKSLRCAELIEKTLVAADKFKWMDEKIAQAHREYETGGDADVDADADADENMDDVSDDEHDEHSTQLLKELIIASDEMQQANKNLAEISVVAKSTDASRASLSTTEQMLEASLATGSIDDAFRDLYMEEFTSAFGDELDQFRQEDRFESKDVTYLISCIQSGADIFTPLQKKLFVEANQTTT